jgi:hypothetical protein
LEKFDGCVLKQKEGVLHGKESYLEKLITA